MSIAEAAAEYRQDRDRRERHGGSGPQIINGGDQTPRRESCFYSASSLKGKPVAPREWLVHGLIPQKTVTLFSGDGGTGKSLLALQLAVAAVSGVDWIGKPVSEGSVIYMSAEDDDDELQDRKSVV